LCVQAHFLERTSFFGHYSQPTANRPNAIGASEVDLLAIEGNVLRVRGLDAIHGTPVLDLKLA
jgi:tRNA (Thr-GGU) A37 N-methylase